MNLAALPRGSSVFIDANTFIYDFSAHPQYGPICKQFLQRIANQELQGFTSVHVLGDLAHRAMTLEAIDQFGWPAKGIAQRLRKHPAEVQKLTRFRQAVDAVSQIGVQVLPIEFPLISAALTISQQHGLLTGDALIVALMRLHRLSNVASADDDFDRVSGLTRSTPA